MPKCVESGVVVITCAGVLLFTSVPGAVHIENITLDILDTVILVKKSCR